MKLRQTVKTKASWSEEVSLHLCCRLSNTSAWCLPAQYYTIQHIKCPIINNLNDKCWMAKPGIEDGVEFASLEIFSFCMISVK